MNFNNHSNLNGCHAFLSASQFHWIRYSDEKIVDRYNKQLAVKKGTELHDFASRCIQLGQKLPKSKKTLNAFVNDAIGYRMETEQVLFYSENCFGTADAISFNEKERFLRIHDLKTGVNPAHFEQLLIYSAMFCLEYGYKPETLTIELRLYQNDEVLILEPDPQDISNIMKTIVRFDKLINKEKMGVEY